MPDDVNDRPEIVSLEAVGDQEAPGDVENNAYLKELRTFFNQIPHLEERQAAILHYVEGMTHKEIAAEVGISESSSQNLAAAGLEYVRVKARGTDT